MTEFSIRQARRRDLPNLWPLARRLDSYNLPADRRYLRQLVATSVRSFRGTLPKSRAKYLFVLERTGNVPGTFPGSRVVGCSLIIAKHGTPRLPHLWMDVKRQAARQVLQLGHTTDGPTEVGGLIVLPAYRKHPARLGLQLSCVRFAYLAIHPERFEPEVLVEYLPPLPGGESRLWAVFGRRLTGLTYRQADCLSMTNKAFILRSFPRTPVDTAEFPPAVRAQIGMVHPAAAGASAMLCRIGFRYLHQVEPFDGGPYFGARRAQITLVRRTRAGRLAVARKGLSPQGTVPCGLVSTEPAPGEFRAVFTAYRRRGSQIQVTGPTMALLEGQPGMRAYATPVAR